MPVRVHVVSSEVPLARLCRRVGAADVGCVVAGAEVCVCVCVCVVSANRENRWVERNRRRR